MIHLRLALRLIWIGRRNKKVCRNESVSEGLSRDGASSPIANDSPDRCARRPADVLADAARDPRAIRVPGRHLQRNVHADDSGTDNGGSDITRSDKNVTDNHRPCQSGAINGTTGNRAASHAPADPERDRASRRDRSQSGIAA